MKKIVAAAVCVALVGCGTTSGRISDLPAITNPNTASKVVTIRVSSLVGVANGYTVVLDDKDLLGIGSGEYAEFNVPEGEHYIGVKCFGGWTPTWKTDAVQFKAVASQPNYFEISPNLKCAGIRQIGEKEGIELTKNSKPIDLQAEAKK